MFGRNMWFRSGDMNLNQRLLVLAKVTTTAAEYRINKKCIYQYGCDDHDGFSSLVSDVWARVRPQAK